MKQRILIHESSVVLCVEDSDARIDWFRARLQNAAYTDEPDEAVRLLAVLKPDVLLLDYDLAPGVTSRPVAYAVVGMKPQPNVLIHSANYWGSMDLIQIIGHGVHAPFGTFELGIRMADGSIVTPT